MKEIGLKTIAKTVADTASYTTMGPIAPTALLFGKTVEKVVDYINDSTEEVSPVVSKSVTRQC